LNGLYRFFLIFSFLAVALGSFFRRVGPGRRIVWIAMAVVLARTVFMGIVGNVETRYTVEAVPGMEMAVVWAVGALWQWRSRRGKLLATS
jgi:hypothetical protein